MEPGSEYTEVIKRDVHRWPLLVEKRAEAFTQARGIWQTWRALMPLRMQARVVWEWLQGRFIYGRFAKFALWSTLRLVPVLGVLVSLFVLFAWWQGMGGRAGKHPGAGSLLASDTNAVTVTLSLDALGATPELTSEEAALWLAFASAHERVKQALLVEAFSSANKAERAFGRADLFAHAMVGLDAGGERSRSLLDTHILPALKAQGSDLGVQLFALRLAAALRLTPDDARAILALTADLVSTKEMPASHGTQLGEALASLAPALESSQDSGPNPAVQRLANALVLRMQRETDVEALAHSARALGALPGMLEPADARALATVLAGRIADVPSSHATHINDALEGLAPLDRKMASADAQPIAEALILRMGKGGDSVALASFGQALGSMASLPSLIGPKDVQAVAKILNVQLAQASDPIALASLGHAVNSLAPVLAAADARALAKVLATRIADAPYSEVVISFANALGTMAPTLPSAEVQAVARALVRRLAYETNDDVVMGVGDALATVTAKLESADVRPLAQLLMERVSSELDSSSLARLAQALASLAPALDAADVAPMAREIARRMEKETDSTLQARLGYALGPLASSLEVAEVKPATTQLATLATGAADSVALAKLGSALDALGPALEPADAQPLAKALMGRMEKETDVYTWASVSGALGALAPKLDAAETTRLATLLAKRVETEHAQGAALARAWVELQAALPESSRREVIQAYVDLLARPLAVGATRKELLHGVEALTGESFKGNLWRFVAWATSDAGRSLGLRL